LTKISVSEHIRSAIDDYGDKFERR
jgi:hypothetical protein